MIPCTSMTAILSLALLSSVITSSSLGPTECTWSLFARNRLPTRLLKFPKRLNTSNTSRIIAKTIQPRPRDEGREAAGATITGGGGGNGGGGASGGGG